jgi:DNA-binding NtrC family response regulator
VVTVRSVCDRAAMRPPREPWYSERLMLPGSPPFPEMETVANVRKTGLRLSMSSLPILVAGEVGTGRRTLAVALAKSRSRDELPIIVASAIEGLPSDFRDWQDGTFVLVLNHLPVLEQRRQNEIAAFVRDRGLPLVATAKLGDGGLAPELAALLECTRLMLPPLREREDDALNWATFFIARAASGLGGEAPRLTVDARRAIAAHSWPGNLSELESVVRRAVVLRESDEIGPDDLGFAEKLVVQPLNDAVEAFRMSYVRKVLAHFDGNRTHAARSLGVDPRTIFRYLAKSKDGEE